MAMQINGNYAHPETEYTEMVKGRQSVQEAEKAKEAEKVPEEKSAGRLSLPQDEYISSEKSGQKPTGLYRVGQDENGNRKIFFDDPKADHANGKDGCSKEGGDGREPKVSGDGQGQPEEKCVVNTDKVDREIKKLKEKQQQLERQIQSAAAAGDEEKIRQLEKKLAQVESELSQKDNDTYRRQNASVSQYPQYG